MENSKQIIKDIILDGTPEEKQVLFSFTIQDTDELIYKKFQLFTRSNYPRYYESKDAPFHKDMVMHFIKSYKGIENWLEVAFRGAAKTSLLKLFVAFVVLNDTENYRKFIKILSKDGKNSKQIVTDVYNLIIEAISIYGSVFDNQDDKKREATMSSFTTNKGVKLASGTVGQTQRGHVQDAYRPDWIWFEDIEDRDTVASITITDGIIRKCDEAIQGLSRSGSYIVTANYISDVGSVQWFMNKPGINTHIVPIVDKSEVPLWDIYTPKMIQKLKDDAEDWAGEYLCDPTRVGNKFFDIDRIEADLLAAEEPKRTSAGVRYWGDYMPHHRFGIGGDLSDGIGKDSCALALFNFTTGLLTATADDNNTPPDLFTHEIARVGSEFGNCIVAPEINNTCGGIAIHTLKEVNYPNIYQLHVEDKAGNVLSTQLGFKTDSKTKPQIFYAFRKDYNDGLIKILDARVLKEMKNFTKADLSDERRTGAVTRHFDLLRSVVIAWKMNDYAIIGGDVKDFYANLANRKRSGTKGAVR